MAQVHPFRATRYSDMTQIKDLVCPPYDVINEAEEQALIAKNAHNVIRLERAYGYAEAKPTLDKWLANGTLTVDEMPSFTIHSQTFDDRGTERTITGIIADVGLEPFENGVVLPHEEILAKARGDRYALMEATHYNFSQIYCLYQDPARSVVSLLEKYITRTPDVMFEDEDGVVHKFWTVSNPAECAAITAAFGDKILYIADGHHRYTTALEFAAENPGVNAGRIMTMLVAMENDGLVIWPTHRLVHSVGDFNATQLLAKLDKTFQITLAPDVSTVEAELAKRADTVALYAGDRHYALLTLRGRTSIDAALPDKSTAYRELDVALLHALILEPALGIGAAELAAQSNIRYTRSLEEAISAVDAGEVQCAFLLNATRIEQMADVSREGERMPQKSTYFYPKFATGVVMKGF